MKSAMPSMNDTTADADMQTGAKSNCSAALARRSSSALGREMLSGLGESSKTIRDKSGSTAPSSETKVATNRASLCDRLTPLLISAGLVKGIIPMSMRRKSNQQTLDTVLFGPDGEGAEKQKAD